MANDKQREANRINAQKSTGPRTQAGKEASRLNALTHGMRARAFDVLPNEDPILFQGRIDAWFEAYDPTDAIQDQLVRHAAILTWKIDRADRHDNALLSGWIRDAMARAEKARGDRLAQAAGQLLPTEEQARGSGFEGDPAPVLLDVLRGSAEGCRWLIERWGMLRDVVRRGDALFPEFEMYAIRLCGGGPGPLWDPEGVGIIVANRMLMPRAELPDPFRRLDAPFRLTIDRQASRAALLHQTTDPAESRALLLTLIERQISGLEATLADRDRDGDLGVEAIDAAGWVAAFDSSAEGERLRRHQASLHRELLRTVATLEKMQASDARASRIRAKEADPAVEEAAPALVEAEAGRIPGQARPGGSLSPGHPAEDDLLAEIGANEANFAPDVQVPSGIVAKRSVASRPDFLLDEPEDAGYLAISCEKG